MRRPVVSVRARAWGLLALWSLSIAACGPKVSLESVVVDAEPVESESPETDAQRWARLGAEIDTAAAAAGRDRVAASHAQIAVEAVIAELDQADDPPTELFARARFAQGLAWDTTGAANAAEAAYRSALDLEPNLSAASWNLAILSLDLGRPAAAQEICQTRLETAPQDTQFWGCVTEALRAQGRLEDAIEVARTALAADADNLEVYCSLGQVYLDMGRLETAQFIFEKAIYSVSGGADDARIRERLGVVYLEMDRAHQARGSFEAALERDPDHVSAMFYLSNHYLDNRNYAGAVELLERARELAPDEPGVRMNLGIAYRGVGRYEDAENEFERALVLEPSDPEPHLNLGILYGDYTKSYDDAVDQYEQYKAKGARDPDLVDDYIYTTLREKEKVELLEARRKKLEEDRKKREEAQRLLEEAAAREAEEAARQAGENDAAPPPSDNNPWGQ